MKVTLNEKCRKHFYIYQNDKKIHTLRKKKPDCYTNNNSPILIKRTTLVREIIYYTIMVAIFITSLVFARPVAALIAGLCSYPINPFDLSNKTNMYIKRPTGSIDLDYMDYHTNATVVNVPRIQFLHIRFYSLMVSLLLIWVFLIESLITNKMPMWMAIMGVYGVVYVIMMYVLIKKYIKSVAKYKNALVENEKTIENI